MKKIWILVHVYRGLVQEPQVFMDRNSAIRRKDQILKHFNPDYDEVVIFEKKL